MFFLFCHSLPSMQAVLFCCDIQLMHVTLWPSPTKQHWEWSTKAHGLELGQVPWQDTLLVRPTKKTQMTLYLSPNNHNFCGPLTWLVAYFLLTGGGFADALPEKQHEFIKLFRHCKQSLCNKDLLHQTAGWKEQPLSSKLMSASLIFNSLTYILFSNPKSLCFFVLLWNASTAINNQSNDDTLPMRATQQYSGAIYQKKMMTPHFQPLFMNPSRKWLVISE